MKIKYAYLAVNGKEMEREGEFPSVQHAIIKLGQEFKHSITPIVRIDGVKVKRRRFTPEERALRESYRKFPHP